MLRQLIASTLIAASLLSIVPAHAETVSQCRERAYKDYDYAVDAGVSPSQAQAVLHRDLGDCEVATKSNDKETLPKRPVSDRQKFVPQPNPEPSGTGH